MVISKFEIWNARHMYGIKMALIMDLYEIVKLILPRIPTSHFPNFLALVHCNVRLLKVLLEHGREELKKPNHRALVNQAMRIMISSGKEEGAELLLAIGGDVNYYIPKNHIYVLEDACREKGGLVSWLLAHGADINMTNRKVPGKPSLLMLACQYGTVEDIKALIQHGQDVNEMSKVHYNQVIMTRFCSKAKPCKGWPLLYAAFYGNFDAAVFLLQNGSKTEYPGKLLTRPIHLACDYYSTRPNREETDPLQESIAACFLAENLIECGAKFNTIRISSLCQAYKQPNSGYSHHQIKVWETPLHIAIRHRFSRMVWLLVSYGANFILDTIFTQQVQKNEVKMTVWEMCDDEETRRALKNEWTPQDHKKFPKVVKRAIECTLLVFKRNDWQLPQHILHGIFQFVAYGWLRKKQTVKKHKITLFRS
eukprot:Phypoly_transcript_06723.p1 GENE.Phypoly_transcript_06723~~Phypoly_transcript_06723.p1  ORF type:complete len:423 (+),score=21.47 Phypoly_transcript_06723:216-1484(+)